MLALSLLCTQTPLVTCIMTLYDINFCSIIKSGKLLLGNIDDNSALGTQKRANYTCLYSTEHLIHPILGKFMASFHAQHLILHHVVKAWYHPG